MNWPRSWNAGWLGLLALSLLPPAWAQCPAKTSVADTLLNADGTPAAGRVVIVWPTFQAGGCQVIAGQTTVAVSDGAFSVELYANDAAVPAGTSYRVTYYLTSGRITTEYWVVPTSGTPVSLAAVRSPSVPIPAVMFSQSQVTNLLADLSRKVELPSPCPAGKFLQANGSPTSPQVSCVDGTGAPLASVTQSGTVKTDVTEADPLVYTKATADSLLAAKAGAVHTHSAADTASGVFDPARLPNPSATTLGGIQSGACSGTDKVTGVSTAGTITCGTDESGGGAGSQHQVNATNLAPNDPVNFQDTATIAFVNPSAGNVQASVVDGSIIAGKLLVANPTGGQLSGVGDANIAAAALSPNRISGTAEIQANKGAANGYAALNGSSKVVQDPANAQTAPAASKIPISGVGGTLDDAWLSSNVTKLGSTIELDGAEVTNNLPTSKGGTGTNNTPTTGRYLRGNGSAFATSSGAAAGTGACTNQFVRAANDDAAPTCASVGTSDISSNAVTRDKVTAAIITRQIIFILGPENGATLADTDDQPSIYANRLGQGITITEVWCESDAGTPSINLQRDDGTPANILSSNLSCSTSGATGTIDLNEDNVANGERIDFVMVTAGGTAKRITVAIKFTLD